MAIEAPCLFVFFKALYACLFTSAVQILERAQTVFRHLKAVPPTHTHTHTHKIAVPMTDLLKRMQIIGQDPSQYYPRK